MQHAATDGVPRGSEARGLAPRLLLRVLREGVPHQELLPHPQVQIPPTGEHPAILMRHKLFDCKIFFAIANTDYLQFTVSVIFEIGLRCFVSVSPQIYKNFKVRFVFKIPPLCWQYFSSGVMFNANIRQLRYLY
jgi:hypothetical protein